MNPMSKKNNLLTRIKEMLKQPEQHFIKFYIRDKFYKQVRCDNLKPGMFLLNDTMILFCNLDQEDTIFQDDKATCDAIIEFLLSTER